MSGWSQDQRAYFANSADIRDGAGKLRHVKCFLFAREPLLRSNPEYSVVVRKKEKANSVGPFRYHSRTVLGNTMPSVAPGQS